MKIWVELVWVCRPGGLLRKRSLLVWDSFNAPLTDEIKALLSQHNTNLVVIPGGLTSTIQPLDVCLNKPFKDHYKVDQLDG